jgi:hypothetical protein
VGDSDSLSIAWRYFGSNEVPLYVSRSDLLHRLTSPTVPSRCRFAAGCRERFCTGSEGAVMRGAGDANMGRER